MTAFLSNGQSCNIDSTLSATVNLTLKNVHFATIVHCPAGPTFWQDATPNAYLHEEFDGKDEGVVSETHNDCVVDLSNCVAERVYGGFTTFDYRNISDATVNITPDPQKNPGNVKFATPAPPRCTVYNSGYSIFCAQLSDGSV